MRKGILFASALVLSALHPAVDEPEGISALLNQPAVIAQTKSIDSIISELELKVKIMQKKQLKLTPNGVLHMISSENVI